MKKIFFSLLLSIPFLSCSTQPNCNDADVKSLVYDIVKQEYAKEIKTEHISEYLDYSYIYSYSREQGIPYTEAEEMMRRELEVEADELARLVVMESTVALDGIRIVEIEENIKKCNCAAKMYLNSEEPLDVEYTAQYTEDDQIYVELFY